ncbi:hypothetical protein FALCPG4_018021 [Fusarium falciforme]
MCPEDAQAAQLQEALADNPLQVDDTHRDDDSVYASSVGSGSFKTSLASSVLNYKYVAGSLKFELVADRRSPTGVRYEAREGQDVWY